MPLRLQVVTPEREVALADDVSLVIAHGIEGDVGIMPGHAPLLIALGVGPLTMVGTDGRRSVMAVDGGFLEVHSNNVIVLAEYAALPHEVDVPALEREIEELRRQAVGRPEDEGARALLARAEAVRRIARG